MTVGSTAAGMPFVGREQEMGVLDGALEAAISGRTRLVLIGGEAGIGKTRLADALATAAIERGARVLWGRSWEAGGAPAYWPWVQIVRAGLGATGGARLRELLGPRAADVARIIPELPDSGTAPTPATKPEGDEERFRVFEATAGLLAALAEAEPIVLILDDLHAADEPSLLLLQFVATQITERRLLVVATYRDDELGADGPTDRRASVIADIARAPGVTRLSPRGLVESEVSAYLEALTPGHGHAGLAAAIQRETEGNPLFMTEVVRLLIEEDRIDQAPDLLGRGFGMTEGVRTVIGRRLARLSEQCLATLGTASLIGTELDIEILAQLDERRRELLLADLDEAGRAHVLVEPIAASDRWRFGHAMFREVLSASLPAATRRHLHHRIALALEGRSGSEPPLAELAFHFAAADDAAKAREYAARAADRAANAFAYEEAVRLYRVALSLGDVDEAERCALLLAFGAAATRGGDERVAKAAFLEAAGIARRLGRVEDLARAAIGYGGRFTWRRAGDDDLLVPLLEDALRALDPSDSSLRVLLLARLAGALRDEPTMERRAAFGAEAVTMARRVGDPVSLGKALIARSAAILGPDAIDEIKLILIETQALARASGDRELLADVQLSQLLVGLGLGDGDRIRATMPETARLARALRQPSHGWYHALSDTSLALLDGRLADAEGLLTIARQQG
ncbi:MAG TPA: AAA family ATPase, partial [Candidatus Eisenbacteria bacterium]|nr:AAA family ATPase [Candidatus Eisenbacteria bacterium]